MGEGTVMHDLYVNVTANFSWRKLRTPVTITDPVNLVKFQVQMGMEITCSLLLEVLMAVTMKMAVFWGVVPCRLV
jgi:hypothetical protein